MYEAHYGTRPVVCGHSLTIDAPFGLLTHFPPQTANNLSFVLEGNGTWEFGLYFGIPLLLLTARRSPRHLRGTQPVAPGDGEGG